MAVKHCLLYTVYAEMKTNRKMRQTLYVRHQLGKGGEGESERMYRCWLQRWIVKLPFYDWINI